MNVGLLEELKRLLEDKRGLFAEGIWETEYELNQKIRDFQTKVDRARRTGGAIKYWENALKAAKRRMRELKADERARRGISVSMPRFSETEAGLKKHPDVKIKSVKDFGVPVDLVKEKGEEWVENVENLRDQDMAVLDKHLAKTKDSKEALEAWESLTLYSNAVVDELQAFVRNVKKLNFSDSGLKSYSAKDLSDQENSASVAFSSAANILHMWKGAQKEFAQDKEAMKATKSIEYAASVVEKWEAPVEALWKDRVEQRPKLYKKAEAEIAVGSSAT